MEVIRRKDESLKQLHMVGISQYVSKFPVNSVNNYLLVNGFESNYGPSSSELSCHLVDCASLLVGFYSRWLRQSVKERDSSEHLITKTWESSDEQK